MSTSVFTARKWDNLWHSTIIANLGQAYRRSRPDNEWVAYLEIGIEYGLTLQAVAEAIQPNGLAVGVDVDCGRCPDQMAGVQLFEMTSDEFFVDWETQFDLIFIDGLHDAEQARRDFANSVEVLKDDGTIILHDTLPIIEQWTSSDVCGDVYKIIPEIVQQDFQVATIPLFPGLTFAVRPQPQPQ